MSKLCLHVNYVYAKQVVQVTCISTLHIRAPSNINHATTQCFRSNLLQYYFKNELSLYFLFVKPTSSMEITPRCPFQKLMLFPKYYKRISICSTMLRFTFTKRTTFLCLSCTCMPKLFEL